MPILFVLRNVSVFFFSRRQKNMDQIARKSTPLPLCLSPNIVGFRLLRTKTLCSVCFTPLEGRGGGGGGQKGGGLSRACLKPRFPACGGKKKPGHFLTQKGSACQISVDSEQLEKSQRNRYIRLSLTEPFKCFSPDGFGMVWCASCGVQTVQALISVEK